MMKDFRTNPPTSLGNSEVVVINDYLSGTTRNIETGTEICCGDPREVTSNPKVIECYLGGDND